MGSGADDKATTWWKNLIKYSMQLLEGMVEAQKSRLHYVDSLKMAIRSLQAD